jgi:hypothetical protein
MSAPVITAVSATNPDGSYGADVEIFITVTFDQAVDVLGASPTLQLETGSTDRKAVMTSGSGTDTLTFKYTVQPGDTSADLNYFSTGSLNADNAIVQASSGAEVASLVLPPLNLPASLAGSKAIVIDTQAPQAQAIDVSMSPDTGMLDNDMVTSSTAVVVSGKLSTALAAGEHLEISLDNGATFSVVALTDPTSWSVPVALREGQGDVLQLRVKDAAGNLGPVYSHPYVADSTAPAAPSAPMLAAGSDTGLSSSDGITANTRPTFTGSAEAGAAVTLYDTGGNVIGSGTAVGGAWSIVPTATLAEGMHTITAIARDAAGNASNASAGTQVAIDTTAPTLSIASDRSSLSAGTSATITFTFSEDPGPTFTGADIDVSGGTLGALSGSGVTRSAVFTPTAGVDGGSASITVAAGSYSDRAGNNGGAGAAPALAVDTMPPAAPSMPDLDAGSDNGASNNDNVTSATQLVFKGTAEAGASITLFDGGREIGGAIAVDGTWSIDTNRVTGAGAHFITAVAVDAYHNVGPMSDALRVDIVGAPTTTVASARLLSDTGTLATDFVTRVAQQTLSGTLSATLAAGEFVEVSADGEHWLQADAPPGASAWSLSTTLAAGTHDLQVRVSDANGGHGAALTQAYTLDTVAPAVTIGSASTHLAAGQDATITFAFSEDPGATFTPADIVVHGGTLASLQGSGATRTAIFTADGSAIAIAVGAGSFADTAGNPNPASASLTLAVDPATPANPNPPAGDDDDGSTVTLVEGVPVTTSKVTLPGGVAGTRTDVPILTSGMGGADGVAAIPLAGSGATLAAHAPVGTGLSASSAVVGHDAALGLFTALTRAGAPSADDAAHLGSAAATFLAGTTASSLLVATLAPASVEAPGGPLVLDSHAAGAPATALLVDATAMTPGVAIILSGTGFAAIRGAATLTLDDGGIVAGDSAAQDITTHAGFTATLLAGGGNDTLRFVAAAGSGSSGATVATVHGGQGTDTAVFAGARAGYDVVFHEGYLTVAAKDAPLLVARVVNVEQLQFADATVAVENDAALATIAGMYQAVLGRQADLDGFAFWAGRQEAGAGWGAIALDMIASSEHGAGFDGDAAHDIGLLYRALFERAVDAGGLAFWEAAMDHGMRLEQVAAAMVASNEMGGHQVAPTGWDFIV